MRGADESNHGRHRKEMRVSGKEVEFKINYLVSTLDIFICQEKMNLCNKSLNLPLHFDEIMHVRAPRKNM